MPPNGPSMDKRKEATDKDHDRFVECHRLMLLRYLDGKAGRSDKELDALGYIDSVLAEWQEAFSNSELTGPSPEERTFWFALYLLEDLLEIPGSNIDPYEKVMMENLIEVRELLRQRQSIEERGYMATRPNGT